LPLIKFQIGFFSGELVDEIVQPQHENLIVIGYATNVTLIGGDVGDDHEMLFERAVVGEFGWLEFPNPTIVTIHK
jgi:hypothetical protein